MEIKRKKIFFTSDLHIGHEGVLSFDKRPFTDLDHMHRVMINNYNATVPVDGICYFLGDIGFCNSEALNKYMSQLNDSTKVVIVGNHDKGLHSMYGHGFDVALNSAIFYIGRNRVSMSHCPLPGLFREDVGGMKGGKDGENWHGESKNQMFMSQDLTVDFHLHGHIHTGPHNSVPRQTDRQYDVGVTANKFKPVSIAAIESWIDTVNKSKK